FEVDQTEDDDRDTVTFALCVIDQRPESVSEKLPNAFALPLQALFRPPQLIRRTPPCPIDIVVTDRYQNKIWKPVRLNELIDLTGQIARSENPPEPRFALAFGIDQRPDTGAVN